MKRSRAVQRLLYRSYGADRPVADPAVLDRVDARLAEELAALRHLGIEVPDAWFHPRTEDGPRP